MHAAVTDLRQFGRALGASPYDTIAELYDPWSRSVTEDVDFYVAEARKSGGTGGRARRRHRPHRDPDRREGEARDRRRLLARDARDCRRRAEAAGVADLLDLRLGDLRNPPVDEHVPLVICPFRSYLHLNDDGERIEALGAARTSLVPGGRLIFDVFEPKPDDIAETHGRWLEREPGIYERAHWDKDARTLTLSVRGPEGAATMSLAWISRKEWQELLEESGFVVEACYGWFDRKPSATART